MLWHGCTVLTRITEEKFILKNNENGTDGACWCKFRGRKMAFSTCAVLQSDHRQCNVYTCLDWVSWRFFSCDALNRGIFLGPSSFNQNFGSKSALFQWKSRGIGHSWQTSFHSRSVTWPILLLWTDCVLCSLKKALSWNIEEEKGWANSVHKHTEVHSNSIRCKQRKCWGTVFHMQGL